MFRIIDKLKDKFSRPSNNKQTEKALCYFGGFEEGAGVNAEAISIHVPTKQGLVCLPYQATNEDVVEIFRSMQIGEAFYLLEEEEIGEAMSGDITKIKRIVPARIISLDHKASCPDTSKLQPY